MFSPKYVILWTYSEKIAYWDTNGLWGPLFI